MTTTLPRTRRSTVPSRPACRGEAELSTQASPCRTRRRRSARASKVLASYVDELGRPRDVVSYGAAHGSRLVIDRDRLTSGDRRLVAHLGADEPAENARIVCDLYMGDDRKRCRQATMQDLYAPAMRGPDGRRSTASKPSRAIHGKELRDATGNRYRLAPVAMRSPFQSFAGTGAAEPPRLPSSR